MAATHRSNQLALIDTQPRVGAADILQCHDPRPSDMHNELCLLVLVPQTFHITIVDLEGLATGSGLQENDVGFSKHGLEGGGVRVRVHGRGSERGSVLYSGEEG